MSTASAPTGGFCDERFAAVGDAFRANFDDPGEISDLGASVAVSVDGEVVVDLWGGYADTERTIPWREDTLTNVWSSTKTMAAICLLVLADRGQIDLDAPVATYWPEFAGQGKQGVLVRHVLGHTAGLPGWELPLSRDDVFDNDLMTTRLAEQAPWWEPGTASGYHALSQGFLLGEIVRRVTGRTLGRFFAEEIAGPVGADFHIGLPAEHDPRVSPVVPPPDRLGAQSEPGSIADRATRYPQLTADIAWDERWRRGEFPAANGHGNARSIADIHSIIACGGSARGIELLSPAGCEQIFTTTARGTDLVLGGPLWMGTGFGIVGPEIPLASGDHICFWGGWGGSLCVIDLDRHLSVSYVMNRMFGGTVGDLRAAMLVLAAFAAVS